MFHFEGVEKKLEISFNSLLNINLLKEKESFWIDELVPASKAKVLSSISNNFCKAYLLSESSLFVYKDKIVMITCGTTTLVKAASIMIDKYSLEAVDTFIYERKHEHFPEYQYSNFYKDVQELKDFIKGKAYRLGPQDDHHVYLFQYDKKCENIEKNDVTLELLMHGLDKKTQDFFINNSDLSLSLIEEKTPLTSLFSDVVFDHYLFEPNGYSLNALTGKGYYTFHVTPEDPVSYVSFETNIVMNYEQKVDLIAKLLSFFQPKRHNIIEFAIELDRKLETPVREEYSLREKCWDVLSCGYQVNFYNFSLSEKYIEQSKAEELLIK